MITKKKSKLKRKNYYCIDFSKKITGINVVLLTSSLTYLPILLISEEQYNMMPATGQLYYTFFGIYNSVEIANLEFSKRLEQEQEKLFGNAFNGDILKKYMS